MDEKDGIIKALKISNDERQLTIDWLLESNIEKDNLIEQLRRRVRCLTEAKERLLKR